MSITILPYIADMPKTATTSNKTTSVTNSKGTTTSSNSNTSTTNFQTTLDTVMKATAAIAIDNLVKASAKGSVNTELVQKFFDENGIAITLSTTNSSNAGTATPISQTASFNNIDIATQTTDTISNSTSTVSTKELDSYFEEASNKYNVSVKLLKAIAYCESNFDPNAVSHAGAVGVMQLMPETAKELGVTNSFDAHQNILGGAKLISQLLNKYDGDTSLALAAYNAGSGNVEKYGGIPPFKETQDYVRKVLKQYNS